MIIESVSVILSGIVGRQEVGFQVVLLDPSALPALCKGTTTCSGRTDRIPSSAVHKLLILRVMYSKTFETGDESDDTSRGQSDSVWG